MGTLTEMAAELRDMEVTVERPSLLAMFDSVFRPELSPAEPKEKEEG